MERPFAGKVALVAGATRGAGRGIAVQLGAAGATVYVTGRPIGSQQSEMNRPETIEETGAIVDSPVGRGIPGQVALQLYLSGRQPASCVEIPPESSGGRQASGPYLASLGSTRF